MVVPQDLRLLGNREAATYRQRVRRTERRVLFNTIDQIINGCHDVGARASPLIFLKAELKLQSPFSASAPFVEVNLTRLQLCEADFFSGIVI